MNASRASRPSHSKISDIKKAGHHVHLARRPIMGNGNPLVTNTLRENKTTSRCFSRANRRADTQNHQTRRMFARRISRA
ncbi:MAG: hypothetical protein WKF71_15010 [Pyrinomonadaceae bacterium]